MAQALGLRRAETDQIVFELDTLESTAENRLEVSGRWFGVRGRRFMRPTLTTFGDAGRSRALAELDHKPWSAEDGELWTAAFPCEPPGGDVLEVELAVAPDIAITFPGPLARRAQGGDAGAGAPAQAVVASRGSSFPGRSGSKAPRRELDELRAALRQQRSENAKLQQELDRATASRAQVRSALARRDAAVSKLDALLHERDAMCSERDRAVSERDRAVSERDRAVSERDGARAQLTRVRAAATAELARIRHEIDQQRMERAVVPREPAALPREPAALPREPAAPPRVPATPSRTGSVSRLESSGRDWLTRACALMVLIAAVVALAIVLHSP